jgi:hypothetical protein
VVLLEGDNEKRLCRPAAGEKQTRIEDFSDTTGILKELEREALSIIPESTQLQRYHRYSERT